MTGKICTRLGRTDNPHVRIGGMSSGSFGEDFFSQLTNYVAHFLSGSKDNIHFLSEHHYSGNAPSSDILTCKESA